MNHIWIRPPNYKPEAFDTVSIMSAVEADDFPTERYHEWFPGGVGDAGKWFPPNLLAERLVLCVNEAYPIYTAQLIVLEDLNFFDLFVYIEGWEVLEGLIYTNDMTKLHFHSVWEAC